jgi:hypothetical protein
VTALHPHDEDAPLDPGLAAIAAAILDGGDTSNLSGDFRLVADIALLHRSLADDDAQPAGFPPEFPWRVGSLTLTSALGRGTYGEVFRAWDNDLHRDVAVKLLFQGSKRADASTRAREEGRLLARVRHPNVVTVHAVEEIDDRIALVTEFIQGRTLAEIVRSSGPLAPAHVATLGMALCGALEAVHGAGLIHRDIKPQNVIREEGGRTVLTDFGASHAADAASSLAGTPLFIAPEIFEGAPATQQSDIYSLGVLLHYAATGRYPVAGASIAEIRQAHARGVRTVLGSHAAIPRALADAIDIATSPDPATRHASAAAFERALEAALEAPRATRRRRLIATGVAAVALASAIGLWAVLKPRPIPDASTASDVASRLTLPGHQSFGGPSFDGRYIAYVDAKQNVVIQQTAAGQPRVIVESELPAGGAEFVALSPDGSLTAYCWRIAGGATELRMVRSDDRWPNTAVRSPPPSVLAASGRAETFDPREFTRDGSQLLALLYRVDGRVELQTHAVNGSGHRVLQAFRPPARPRRATFSADGRFVIFDLPLDTSTDRALFVVPSDGSRAPVRLEVHLPNAQLPFVSADGEHLFFVATGDDGEHVWRVRFRNGSVSGSPRGAARRAHGMTPIAVTSSGDIYYALQTKREQLMRIGLDTNGAIEGSAVTFGDADGISKRFPVWSPKGDKLAYVAIRGMNLYDFGNHLGLLHADGTTRRGVTPALLYYGGAPIDWSPDGRAVLIRGRGADGFYGYYAVDIETGAATALVTSGPRGEEQNLGGAAAFGDNGRSLIWRKLGAGLIKRDLEKGDERIMVSEAGGGPISSFSVSHRDQGIAFVRANRSPQRGSTLNVLEPDGTVREILTQRGASPIIVMQWAADGQSIMFVSTGRPQKLWRVARSGGAPVDAGLTIEATRPRVAIRPDGREMIYTTGSTAFETWVMRGLAR